MRDTAESLAEIYRPTHDESARHRFVGALKSYLNQQLEAALAERYECRIEPAWRAANGRAPADREEGSAAMAADRLYQLWGSAVFTSQDLMWESVGATCERILPAFADCAAQVVAEPRDARGSLELDPGLEIPEPIRSIEIHRQPGGYFDERDEPGLLAGLRYFGTVELYRSAKGLSASTRAGEPGMGEFVLGAVARRLPALEPRTIVDLGCGNGTETIAYQRAYPQATVWGIDLSAPLLRFAHAWAEDQKAPIRFRQADARRTGLPDASVDLIVSNILFHETWHDILPGIMQEAHRLLRPGGLFLNVDTPYQPARLTIPQQVTNHWQVVNNGEPFWTGYADTDIPAALRAAGFGPDEVFADYEPLGQGVMYVFGACTGPVR